MAYKSAVLTQFSDIFGFRIQNPAHCDFVFDPENQIVKSVSVYSNTLFNNDPCICSVSLFADEEHIWDFNLISSVDTSESSSFGYGDNRLNFKEPLKVSKLTFRCFHKLRLVLGYNMDYSVICLVEYDSIKK